jgi:glutamine synthetase
MVELKEIIPTETGFIRVVWCDNANIIRAKAVKLESIQGEDISVGICRAQQAIPVIYDGIVEGTGLDPVGEITLKGDTSNLTPLPYAPGHARVMGDMMEKGKPWEHCPRGFLKRMISQGETRGLEIKAAFENEFYLLKEGNKPADSTPFASTYSMDLNHQVIEDMVNALQAQGIGVEQYYPESGPGQQEITTIYTHALKAADNQIAFRETVKAIALRHNLLASFLPKIFPDKAGSGCHLHLSIWRDGRNITGNPEDDYGLSETARQFIAGILHHLPSLMAITTPTGRSYRRIKPKMWSGAYKCWGIANREAAIRVIPEDNGEIKHFELKTVDASSNPYLALGAVIAAGLDGVDLELMKPVQKDPGTLSSSERDELEIKLLPSDLGEAIKHLKKNKKILKAMGEALSTSYLAVKRAEWDFLRRISSDKELELLIDKY